MITFNIVPYFDLAALIFIVVTIIQLLKIKVFRAFSSTLILFVFSFSMFGIIMFFNVLEHFNITHIFDPFEDYAEILLTPLLIFSFYSYYLNIELKRRKDTEEELNLALEKAKESNRLKSAFLANMSHEIRTPMNAILGFTELIFKDNLVPEKKNLFGEIVETNSKLLLSLINDIIDISKIESGQLEVLPEEFDLQEELIEIYKLFENQIKNKSLEFHLQIDAELENQVVFSDPFRVKQIFTNLLTNAIKFTDSGYIEMGAVFKYPFIEFYVKDTGEGIAKREQELIFERFIQSKIQDIDKVHKGTGLGLAISKALAMKLGGHIGVDTKLGKGSRFFFTIPHNKMNTIAPDNDIEESFASNIKLDNLNILIAEDEDSNYIFFEEILENSNVNLIRTFNGNETVEKVKSDSSIDLIFMDIRMPGMDGLNAASAIRKFNKDVIIIAQTAYAMIGDKEKAIQSGCNDYISKPFKSSDIISLINTYLK
jgi:signal transduction histidine kinase/CheY-like chemotaxis protein